MEFINYVFDEVNISFRYVNLNSQKIACSYNLYLIFIVVINKNYTTMVVYVTILQYRICTNFDYQEYEYLRDISAEIHVSF